MSQSVQNSEMTLGLVCLYELLFIMKKTKQSGHATSSFHLSVSAAVTDFLLENEALRVMWVFQMIASSFTSLKYLHMYMYGGWHGPALPGPLE